MPTTTTERKIPCISMSIPLLTRVLEYAREDLKSDEELHFMIEELINIGLDDCLDMKSYQKIINSVPKVVE